MFYTLEQKAQKKKKLAAEKKAKEALAAANKAAANVAVVTPNKNQVQVAIPTLNSKPTGQQAAGGAQGLELKSAENLKPYERLTKGEMRAIDEIMLTGIATGGAGKCTLFGAKDGSPHACMIDILAITLDQNVCHADLLLQSLQPLQRRSCSRRLHRRRAWRI